MGIYQHLLTTGTEDTQQQDLSREFCACFTTITTTSDMSTPETHMRAALAKAQYLNNFEKMCQDMDSIPLVYCSSIEAHLGN